MALAGLAAVALATAMTAIGAAAGRSPLVDNGHPLPRGALGPFAGLGSALHSTGLTELLLVMAAGYAALVWANALSWRAAGAAVVGLHLIVLLAPPLLSADVFSYLAYARLGALHGLNPYVHGPAAFPADLVYPYVAPRWHHEPSAYGPLFTVVSYPAAWLGLAGGVVMLKAVAVAGSLATVTLGALCARRRGRDPARAALTLGANPFLLLFGAGGAHNDLPMLALTMAGVLLALDRRDGLGAAATVAGAAVKATAVIVLPFMLVGRRRPLQTLAGAGAAAAAGVVLALVAFGDEAGGFVSVLRHQQGLVSRNSFATEVLHLFGPRGVLPLERLLLQALLAGALVYLLVRVWRGADWISGAGWAMLALALTTTWLLPWYTVWPLPFAVAARDRRLLAATLTVQAVYLVHRLGPLIVPA